MTVTLACIPFSGLKSSYPLSSTLLTTNQRSCLSEIYLLIFYLWSSSQIFHLFSHAKRKLWAFISKVSRSFIIRSWPTFATSPSKLLTWIFFIKHCFLCLAKELFVYPYIYVWQIWKCAHNPLSLFCFVLKLYYPLGWLMGMTGLEVVSKGWAIPFSVRTSYFFCGILPWEWAL